MSRTFDGTDDVIEVVSTIVTAYPLTLLAWFKSTATTTGQVVVGLSRTGGAGQGRKLIYLNGDGTLRLYAQNNGASSSFPSSGTYSSGVWTHAAAVFAANNDFRIYRDGGNVGSDTSTVDFGTINTFKVGADDSAAPSNFMDGSVAFVHIYNRALSVNEIKQLMRFPGSISLGLKGFLELLGANPEFDYSGNGNNGMVTGALVSNNNPPVNGIFTIPKPELAHVF